ncbi:MAG TPA: peptide ABC transporter substrate-binding protein [Gaiellaceae bacterium]|nr:peptide ABC transporter substrate-binding protein [Gaiellaceae bacterium]
MSRKWLAAVPLAIAALIFATTATGSGSSAKSGGTFRLGTASGIDSLNPYVAFNQDAYSAFEYIYPILVQYDSQLHYAPFFATSWHASKDGKSFTFKTQPHAKWSDGKPLTAADAAWTINTDVKYKDGATANVAGLVSHITGAKAPNATTLVVNYDARVNPTWVLGQFQQYAILPQHIWAQHIGKKGAGLKTFPNSAPIVGSGPFNLVRFKQNDIALFQRNSSYWGPKPQIDVFGLQQYSNDDAMITALKAHDLDAVESVPATTMKTLRGSGFVVQDVKGLDTTDFIINSNPKKKHHRELLNLKVKEAFDHAIDRKKIVSVVYLGAAQVPSSIIPASAGAGWHNTTLKPPTFDLALANRILDKLGYKKGPGGIRVANGKKMSYDVIIPTDVQSLPRTFQIIQADFAKIGVQLKEKALDSTAAFNQMAGSNYTYQGFDLAMWDWTALIDPDFMLSVTTCAQWGGWSDSGFCDKRYDKMYSQQQTAATAAQRRKIVWQMQAYLYKHRPYLWLANDDQVSAVSKSWAGFTNTPQGPFNELSISVLTHVHQK